MTHAQLIECVGVVCGDVRDHNVGGQQQLIHRNVDIPGMLNLISPLTLVTGSLRCRLDDVFVGLVQVEHSAGWIVGLLPEPHHNEAGRHRSEITTPLPKDLDIAHPRPSTKCPPGGYAYAWAIQFQADCVDNS